MPANVGGKSFCAKDSTICNIFIAENSLYNPHWFSLKFSA